MVLSIMFVFSLPRVASGIHRAIAAQLQVFHLENLKPVYARYVYLAWLLLAQL